MKEYYGNNDWRDYLIHRDQQDHLQHDWAVHKYIAKIGKGVKARYFYTKEELESYYKQKKKEVKRAKRKKDVEDFLNDPNKAVDRKYSEHKRKKAIEGFKKDPVNQARKQAREKTQPEPKTLADYIDRAYDNSKTVRKISKKLGEWEDNRQKSFNDEMTKYAEEIYEEKRRKNKKFLKDM